VHSQPRPPRGHLVAEKSRRLWSHSCDDQKRLAGKSRPSLPGTREKSPLLRPGVAVSSTSDCCQPSNPSQFRTPFEIQGCIVRNIDVRNIVHSRSDQVKLGRHGRIEAIGLRGIHTPVRESMNVLHAHGTSESLTPQHASAAKTVKVWCHIRRNAMGIHARATITSCVTKMITAELRAERSARTLYSVTSLVPLPSQ